MRLRSRNILNETPTPSRRRRAAPETPQVQTQDEVKVLQDRFSLDADEVPTVAKRPRRRRKALSTVDNKVGEKPNSGPMFSPEHCVFSYSAASSLSEDEENEEVFSPFTFIKNIPNRSQQSRPVSAVRDIPPKTRSTPAATLVLDLDETLVFSSLNVIHDAEYTFNTHFQDHKYKVYVILRPYVKEFLQAMTKHFEMFVYTSAKKEYAEKIVDILDPNKKLFRHRLYQDDCACVLGHYIKDLTVLERDLSKTVILDNAPHTFPYHLMNMIPVKSWIGDQEDRELQKLIPYMEKLVHADDIRNVLKKRTDHFHRLLSED
ncbi:CTD small phosphatase-like protein 2 isoform X5 [Cyprinus carpio]|uniref:CTD small phosphatase-like protein 2 isoform X5 n=1 Tax=Cyprinus carpio TaxID=7962 RepID=A0A9Q9YKR0_CYPCA|nr:CTD small phosphatase-like protein 2 isoform X5 [Cyprinus carpio]